MPQQQLYGITQQKRVVEKEMSNQELTQNMSEKLLKNISKSWHEVHSVLGLLNCMYPN